MSGRFVLDTNIVIALMRGEAAASAKAEFADELFVPAPVAGELYFGAAKSARPERNLADMRAYLTQRSILLCDLSVAEQYGFLKQRLRAKGHPIPENDMWIAAVALANDLPLVTRDGHFDNVEGLTVVHW